MLPKHSKCGLSVFCFFDDVLRIEFHKSRAALSKEIKIIKLISSHGYSSFVIYCLTLYSSSHGLSIGFRKFL